MNTSTLSQGNRTEAPESEGSGSATYEIDLPVWCARQAAILRSNNVSQPDRRSPSWISVIDTQRREIEPLLHASPGLRSLVAETATEIYPRAWRNAAKETRLTTRPQELFFGIEKILEENLYPD